MAKSRKKKNRRRKIKKRYPMNRNGLKLHFVAVDTESMVEQRLRKLEDLHELQRSNRSKRQMENRNIDDLIDEATQKVKDFKMCHDYETKNDTLKFESNFMQVINFADIVLEVLDARDPLGSRCPQVEESVLDMGKKLILVLNKIDLIPKNNLLEWLKYLRQVAPTIAFKASIETQDDYFPQSEDAVGFKSESLLSSQCCVGASFLFNVLENYIRNQNIHTLIKVGVVGYPNVGKKCIIKSLKHFHPSSEAIATDLTYVIQNFSLDKHFEILDNPGIVYAKGDSSVTLALRNAVQPEDLIDVTSPAEAIFQKIDPKQLCLHYCIPHFSSCQEFLSSLAAKMGKFKISGVPDFRKGARRLINDWNSGKIKYHTYPPESISDEHIAEMNQVFDISHENELIELNKAPLLFPISSIPIKSSEPIKGSVEKEIETDDCTLVKVVTEYNTNNRSTTDFEDESYKPVTKRKMKFLDRKLRQHVAKHKKKKFNKLALALSESIATSLKLE